MSHKICYVIKVHVDNLISCHVVGYSKVITNWFVAKLNPNLSGGPLMGVI